MSSGRKPKSVTEVAEMVAERLNDADFSLGAPELVSFGWTIVKIPLDRYQFAQRVDALENFRCKKTDVSVEVMVSNGHIFYESYMKGIGE